jgi:hypothetical protein
VYALLVERERGVAEGVPRTLHCIVGVQMRVERGSGGAGNEGQCNAIYLSIYMYSLPTLPRLHCATLSIHTTLFGEPRLISPMPTVLLRTSGTTMTVSP